ncbi:MAG: DUF362 domain-containing protein [Candidatus Hodarchaeota archaeon]
MAKSVVSIVKYEKPLESVRKAVELTKSFDDISPGMKVFIKPNIVFWSRHVPIPKWGVLTTSRVIEDIIVLLKEKGIDDITIGEGIVTEDIKDKLTAPDAWEKLGYNKLIEKYGIKVYNILERPFEKIDLGLDFIVEFNSDALNSDVIIDVPVLKTHAQCIVSISIKNLKGLISIATRKKFHSADPVKNLDYNIARLPEKLPPVVSVVDGIYTLERGPAIDGKARRSNILLASKDILSADLVGAKLLGWDPSKVPHLVHAAEKRNRSTGLSDVDVVGEKIDDLASFHNYDYIYEENDTIPLPFAKAGIKGVTYHKYDKTMCTYCSFLNGVILSGIKMAWVGKPFDNVEILTGKSMKPTPGKNKTILLGQCMYNANKNHPNIKELIPVKGCPPSKEALKEALDKAGFDVPDMLFKNLDKAPMIFLNKYRGKPEFDESFYQIP